MGLPNPITTVGTGLEKIGNGLGGAVTTSNDWLEDRAKDVVRGDTFGINRRENEDLRRTFDEKLSESNATLADLREQLEPTGLTGKTGGKEMTDAVTSSVHGETSSTGALAKSLDASYTVAEGDTLWDIAEGKGTSVADLLGLNPELGDGNLIHAGQEIKLDGFVTEESPAAQTETSSAPAAPTPEAGFEPQI